MASAIRIMSCRDIFFISDLRFLLLIGVKIRPRVEEILFQGAIMSLPGRNHLSQVSTTCTAAVFVIPVGFR